jgi:rhamnosyltransferase
MNDRSPSRQKTAAVVVSHHPDAAFPERLPVLAAQFGHVVVVDNHSDDAARTAIREFAASQAHAAFIPNDVNVGIAAALNQGCRLAAERGADWVVTFDQDSLPAADFLTCVASEWHAQSARNRIGLIGVNFQTSAGKTLIAAGSGMADARVVITSGTLLNLVAYREVGPFREDFFIDEVDHEYAIRLRRTGWLVKVTRRVLMEHALGSPQGPHFGRWRPVVSHHSAIRRYYMVRNRVLLARAHFDFEPRFVISQLGRSVREAATVLLFEPKKAAKLQAMSAGLVDGLRGRAGRAAAHAP